MTRAPWAWAAASGMMLAAGAGCYSPPQYGTPYGGYPAYQAAPGYPAGQPYPAAPGGSYVVPGGTLGTPSTIVPGTGSGPTLAPPLGATTTPPTFEGGSSGSSGPSVPDDGYRDPNTGDFETPNGGFGPAPSGGFQPPANGAAPGGAPNTGSPLMEGTAIPRRLGTETVARPIGRNDYLAGLDRYGRTGRPAASKDLAVRDTGVRPATFEENAQADFGFDPVTSPERPGVSDADRPFGYDATGYRWIRGVVDYDADHRNWSIIYGLPPDPNDEFGGCLTLADDAVLRDFQGNDVVQVEGRIDPSAGRDELGKPLYRVMKAELVGRYE